MKIVKNGRVYDLGYDKYDTVTRIPSKWRSNSVGNPVDVKRELRKDRTSGEFYVLSYDEGYHRGSYAIDPVTKDEAARLSEDLLEYDEYVKFFGDPEGTDAGLARERDAAVDAKKEAERSKDYWYEEYSKATQKISKLEDRLAELETKLEEK